MPNRHFYSSQPASQPASKPGQARQGQAGQSKQAKRTSKQSKQAGGNKEGVCSVRFDQNGRVKPRPHQAPREPQAQPAQRRLQWTRPSLLRRTSCTMTIRPMWLPAMLANSAAKWVQQTLFQDSRRGCEASWLIYRRNFVGCILCKAAGFAMCLANAWPPPSCQTSFAMLRKPWIIRRLCNAPTVFQDPKKENTPWCSTPLKKVFNKTAPQKVSEAPC